ncbi:MAG: host-nuclease inhibitor protein Gam [Syntrophorhabdus sp.]|nr:host-nuclease inhibitor protein Gam [Syntrophorhabdus sp.]
MAKIIKTSDYTDWPEVDGALRRMGEIDIKLQKLEGEMTLKINEIKAEYDVKAEGLKAEHKAIEENITLFAESRKQEFARVRSKDLTFGVVAYRVVTKVVLKSKAATVAALKALGLVQYLRIIEEPDKEAMSGLDATTLAKCGATLKTEDKLRIEPNMEKIKEKEAA